LGTPVGISRLIATYALLFTCLLRFVPSVWAQDPGNSNPPVLVQNLGISHENRIPFLRAGIFYGRTGTAKGPSSYLEINPSRWFGFCGFAARSGAASQPDGAAVQTWDFTSGVCVTAHAPEVKGFLISPFVQIEYQSDHDHISFPLGDGTFYQESDNHQRHVMTYGTTIDRAIVKNGPRWAIRAGKNYGGGPAANNAGGLYLTGGVIFPLDHPVELSRSFRKMAWWKR